MAWVPKKRRHGDWGTKVRSEVLGTYNIGPYNLFLGFTIRKWYIISMARN